MAGSALASKPSSAPANACASQQTAANLDWLDALKGIAILAVVSDHAFIVSDYLVWKHLYFAVSWFILLAGVSNTYSARRRGFDLRRDTPEFWRRRLATLLPPYLGASAFAFVTLCVGRKAVGVFLQELAGFHTLPPLYFIPLLLQFLLAFPVLYLLLYQRGWWGRLIVAVLAVPVAAVLSQRITFGWPLAAHYFLGASLLYFFLLGMVLQPLLTSRRLPALPLLLCSASAFAWAERVNVATGGTLMTHPPSNLLLIYAISLLGIAYSLCRLFSASLPVRAAAWLGQRSLQIFVYHYPFLTPIFAYRYAVWTNRLPLGWNQVLLMALAIPVAIAGSVLVARLITILPSLLLRRVSRKVRTSPVTPLYTVADRKGM